MSVSLVRVDDDNVDLMAYAHELHFHERYHRHVYTSCADGLFLYGYLAYKNNELAGEIMLRWDLKKGLLLLYVVSISVMEEFRRKKIGSALIEQAIKDAGNAEAMFLHARVSNTIAHSLYHKYGFKEISVFPKYYEDEDAFVFRRVNPNRDQCEKKDFMRELLEFNMDEKTPFKLSHSKDIYVDDLIVKFIPDRPEALEPIEEEPTILEDDMPIPLMDLPVIAPVPDETNAWMEKEKREPANETK